MYLYVRISLLLPHAVLNSQQETLFRSHKLQVKKNENYILLFICFNFPESRINLHMLKISYYK